MVLQRQDSTVVATEAETIFPQRVVVHSISLGGFYYSAAWRPRQDQVD